MLALQIYWSSAGVVGASRARATDAAHLAAARHTRAKGSRWDVLIHNGKDFIQTSFDSEEELESVVTDNSERIFGPSSIYLSKTLLKTKEGTGTIPDGFVIDLASRQWYIVEAELTRHSVWSHIAPQVAKQIIAAGQPSSKSRIVDEVVRMMKHDDQVAEKFVDEGIQTVDIRKVLNEIVETTPVVAMPIDAISDDLREWAQTVKSDVKLWLVKKYAEFRDDSNVIYEVPEEYRPALDTKEEKEREGGRAQYDVTVLDLIDAGLVSVGEELVMSYKPSDGDRREYHATIEEDGALSVLGKSFSAPSYAALHGIQDAGSHRTAVNGWRSWKNRAGLALREIRDEYLSLERGQV